MQFFCPVSWSYVNHLGKNIVFSIFCPVSEAQSGQKILFWPVLPMASLFFWEMLEFTYFSRGRWAKIKIWAFNAHGRGKSGEGRKSRVNRNLPNFWGDALEDMY